ncbi:hypothetical protein [Alcanivorax sp.]|uniref:hypothetical protein n=1 Tax=Alcanivorax sp. TaxID=1872427 RepID=UPI000C11CF97|nr:hypothetical protein [Alcanivorax sp.]PHR67192.1 MAG: hypothetical protein COA55_07310 [Alcanivorax sp.]
MYKLARLGLFIMVISTLSGCGETTFDADNHVDSFIELANNAPPETDTQLLFELWDVYLRGYVDHDGNVIEPDFAKLDGMNAEEILQELKNHIDFVQFEGFEMATIDDDGNYVDPAIYGNGGSPGSGHPSVDIRLNGRTVYLTAKEDEVTVHDVVFNRGNCGHGSFKAGRELTLKETKMVDLGKLNINMVYNPATETFHEGASLFPASAKFGQKLTAKAEPGCNIIEVSVTDDNGTWTWEFQ